MLDALQAALGFHETLDKTQRCDWCKKPLGLSEPTVLDTEGNLFHSIAEAERYDIEQSQLLRYELRYIEPEKETAEEGLINDPRD